MSRQLTVEELSLLSRKSKNEEAKKAEHVYFSIEEKRLAIEAYDQGKDYVFFPNRKRNFSVTRKNERYLWIQPLSGALVPCGEIECYGGISPR